MIAGSQITWQCCSANAHIWRCCTAQLTLLLKKSIIHNGMCTRSRDLSVNHLISHLPYLGMLKPWVGTADHVTNLVISLAWEQTTVCVMSLTCTQLHTLSYVIPTAVSALGPWIRNSKIAQFFWRISLKNHETRCLWGRWIRWRCSFPLKVREVVENRS